MFLAYSDPFEKYRALLFEYAHTLGHGIEAFANALYARAERKGMSVPSGAQRLHGQCVGMAVVWAGEMSKELGVLEGKGLELHQSFVYLFNRHGGFTFAPLRRLCEKLSVDVEELVSRLEPLCLLSDQGLVLSNLFLMLFCTLHLACDKTD